MALNVYKFGSLEEVNVFLRGGVIGGPLPVGGVYGLVGTTLTFTTPADSVAFVAATPPGGNQRDPQALLFSDIKAQLEAAIPGLRVINARGSLAIIEATPTAGVVIDAASAAAKALLGFDIDAAVTGKVYTKPGGAVPSLVSIAPWEHGYTVVVEE
jgi:hypothetical protein